MTEARNRVEWEVCLIPVPLVFEKKETGPRIVTSARPVEGCLSPGESTD